MDESYVSDSEHAPEPHQFRRRNVLTKASPSLSARAQEMLSHLDGLRLFLITAPYNHATGQITVSTADHHSALNRFPLPNGELVTCVYWQSLYHITGTDIVRALVFRFEAFGRPVRNMKKFEEGVFSDLRNLKPGIDACLEDPKSPFLELLFKYQCIRTQKKQKVFYWFSVPHDRLFLDALERDIKREKMGLSSTTDIVGEPARSFVYDPRRSLYDQFIQGQGGIDGESDLERAIRLRETVNFAADKNRKLTNAVDSDIDIYQSSADEGQSSGSTLIGWSSGAADSGASQLPLFDGVSLVGGPSHYKRRKKYAPGSLETPPTIRHCRNDRLPHYFYREHAPDTGGSAHSCAKCKVSELCMDQKCQTTAQAESSPPTRHLSYPPPQLNPPAHTHRACDYISPHPHGSTHDLSCPTSMQSPEVIKGFSTRSEDTLLCSHRFGQTSGHQQTIHTSCLSCHTTRHPIEDEDDLVILTPALSEGGKIFSQPKQSYNDTQSLDDIAHVHNGKLGMQSQRLTHGPHLPCINSPPSIKTQGSAQPIHSGYQYQHTRSSHLSDHVSPPQYHGFKMEGTTVSSSSFSSAVAESSTTVYDAKNIDLPSLVTSDDGRSKDTSFISRNPTLNRCSFDSHPDSKSSPSAPAQKPVPGRRLPYSPGVGVSKTGWRESRVGSVRRHHSITPISSIQYQSSRRPNKRNGTVPFYPPEESPAKHGGSLTRVSSSASSTSSGRNRTHQRVPGLLSYDSNEASDTSTGHESGLITVQDSLPFTSFLQSHVSTSPSHFAPPSFGDNASITSASTHAPETSSDLIRRRLDHWDQLCLTSTNTLIDPTVLDSPGYHDPSVHQPQSFPRPRTPGRTGDSPRHSTVYLTQASQPRPVTPTKETNSSYDQVHSAIPFVLERWPPTEADWCQ